MATNQGGTGRPEGPGQGEARHSVFELLKDEEDRSVLRLWRQSLSLLDPRYKSKVLLKLVALAMTDEQIRSRLINDTEGVLREIQTEPHSNVDLPEGTTVRFLENTQNTLNVVLPPQAGGMIYSWSGEMSYRSPAMREALRSRTSSTEALPDPGTQDQHMFKDDWDSGNVMDIRDYGDPDRKDDSPIQDY